MNMMMIRTKCWLSKHTHICTPTSMYSKPPCNTCPRGGGGIGTVFSCSFWTHYLESIAGPQILQLLADLGRRSIQLLGNGLLFSGVQRVELLA